MKQRIRQILFSGILLFLSVRCGIDIYDRYREYLNAGKLVPTFLLIGAVLLFGTVYTAVLIWKPSLFGRSDRVKARVPGLCACLSVLISLTPAVLYNFLPFSEPYRGRWIRIFIYALAILLAARVRESDTDVHFGSLCQASLFFAAAFAFADQFRDISAYPFSIGWSEGNRIWDYSVLFGKRLYDFPQDQTIPAYIDIGRQSLWGGIFLLPRVSIVGMRLWNDFLFTIPCAILGWVLLRKTAPDSRTQRLALGLWTMLFLMQGPIYTPLTIAAIIVALARRTPLAVNCLLTMAAGIYAVMSRSTWVAAPAAFAALLAFIEVPASGERSPKERWLRALAVGISGFAGAGLYLKRDIFLPSQAVESAAAAENAAAAIEAVPSLFTPEWFSYYLGRQALLWDRLWPNETYKPGIVFGLAMAVLPSVLLLICWRVERTWKTDFWQKLLLIGGSAIFLGAGLVISVKIGGGSNLHNLDMYLIFTLFIAFLAWEAGMGEWLKEKIRSDSLISLIVLTAILLPVIPDALKAEPRIFPDKVRTADALEHVQQVVQAHSDEDILFMDQRQLLTFGKVGRIPLIADYEKKWMMDEAMANDAAYFEPYIADVKAHRFAVIISEPLHVNFKGAGGDFSEENDLFVKWVSLPTLCSYEPYETFPEHGVQILVPREGSLTEIEGYSCP